MNFAPFVHADRIVRNVKKFRSAFERRDDAEIDEQESYPRIGEEEYCDIKIEEYRSENLRTQERELDVRGKHPDHIRDEKRHDEHGGGKRKQYDRRDDSKDDPPKSLFARRLIQFLYRRLLAFGECVGFLL